MRIRYTLAAAALALTGCDTAAPSTTGAFAEVGGADDTGAFNTASLVIAAPQADAPYYDGPALVDAMVAYIDAAETTVDAAFDEVDNEAVVAALVRAHERGVRTRVVGDLDRAAAPGFAALRASGVAIAFGDGAIAWQPQPGLVVNRAGSHNRMSHNFVVVDSEKVFSLTGGFKATGPTFQLGFVVDSEDLARDFEDEFQQIFGGLFATTLTGYGAVAKSDQNERWVYPTNAGRLELYFGPQERAQSRVLDTAYMARSSVWIATEELTSGPLVELLRYKAEAGFDVRVVVDADGASAEGSRYAELELLFGAIRAERDAETPRIGTLDGVDGSLVLLDVLDPQAGRAAGDTNVWISTTGLVETVPYAVGPVSRASDGFIDAHVWGLSRPPQGESAAIDALVGAFGALEAGAER